MCLTSMVISMSFYTKNSMEFSIDTFFLCFFLDAHNILATELTHSYRKYFLNEAIFQFNLFDAH